MLIFFCSLSLQWVPTTPSGNHWRSFSGFKPDLAKLPLPDTLTQVTILPLSALYSSTLAVEPLAESCTQSLMIAGWVPYWSAGQSRYFKKNNILLNVMISSPPGQNEKSMLKPILVFDTLLRLGKLYHITWEVHGSGKSRNMRCKQCWFFLYSLNVMIEKIFTIPKIKEVPDVRHLRHSALSSEELCALLSSEVKALSSTSRPKLKVKRECWAWV